MSVSFGLIKLIFYKSSEEVYTTACHTIGVLRGRGLDQPAPFFSFIFCFLFLWLSFFCVGLLMFGDDFLTHFSCSMFEDDFSSNFNTLFV